MKRTDKRPVPMTEQDIDDALMLRRGYVQECEQRIAELESANAELEGQLAVAKRRDFFDAEILLHDCNKRGGELERREALLTAFVAATDDLINHCMWATEGNAPYARAQAIRLQLAEACGLEIPSDTNGGTE